MKNRGLYNQKEGNENRSSFEVFQERCEDNKVVEGEAIAKLRLLFCAFLRNNNDKTRQDMNDYIVKLKSDGWKQHRIDAAISQATYRMKV